MAISAPVASAILNSTANGTVYDCAATGSLSVDDVALVFVMPVRLAANGATAAPTMSNLGTATIGSFTQIGSGMSFTNTDHYGLYCYWVKITGAGTFQPRATFAGANYAGCRIVAYPLRGTDLTAPVTNVDEYSTSVGTTDPTHTLASAPAATSWCFEANMIRRNPPAWTPDATNGWVEDHDLGQSNPAQGGYVSHTETGGVQSVTHTGTDGTHMSIMFEVVVPGGTNASVTPTTVDATTTVPTPVVTGSASATPTTVSAVVTIPTPTVTTVSPDASVTPTTVTATVSIPTPAVSGSASVTPTTVSVTTTVPTPAVSGSASVTPTTVSASTTVPTPAISAGVSITPTTVDAVVTIPTPSVSIGGNVSIELTTVMASVSIPAPAVSGSASVTPTTVSAAVTISAPSVSGSASVTPTTVSASTTVPTPALTLSATVALTTVEASVSISGVAVTVPTVHKASEWGRRRTIQRGNAGWKYVNRPGRAR